MLRPPLAAVPCTFAQPQDRYRQGKPASVNALEMAATNSGRERMDCAVRSKPATVESGTASMRRAAATRASLSFPRRQRADRARRRLNPYAVAFPSAA
jgi:hypothetical protein